MTTPLKTGHLSKLDKEAGSDWLLGHKTKWVSLLEGGLLLYADEAAARAKPKSIDLRNVSTLSCITACANAPPGAFDICLRKGGRVFTFAPETGDPRDSDSWLRLLANMVPEAAVPPELAVHRVLDAIASQHVAPAGSGRQLKRVFSWSRPGPGKALGEQVKRGNSWSQVLRRGNSWSRRPVRGGGDGDGDGGTMPPSEVSSSSSSPTAAASASASPASSANPSLSSPPLSSLEPFLTPPLASRSHATRDYDLSESRDPFLNPDLHATPQDTPGSAENGVKLASKLPADQPWTKVTRLVLGLKRTPSARPCCW